jgi:hypothetical protein
MSNPSEQGDDPASPAEARAAAAAFAAALAPMTAALQNVSVAPPTPTASNVSAAPVVAAPVIHLPANTMKLPSFKGTMPDPRSSDRKAEISASLAIVASILQRMDAFFDPYAQSFPTERLKLNALISGCNGDKHTNKLTWTQYMWLRSRSSICSKLIKANPAVVRSNPHQL